MNIFMIYCVCRYSPTYKKHTVKINGMFGPPPFSVLPYHDSVRCSKRDPVHILMNIMKLSFGLMSNKGDERYSPKRRKFCSENQPGLAYTRATGEGRPCRPRWVASPKQLA